MSVPSRPVIRGPGRLTATGGKMLGREEEGAGSESVMKGRRESGFSYFIFLKLS